MKRLALLLALILLASGCSLRPPAVSRPPAADPPAPQQPVEPPTSVTAPGPAVAAAPVVALRTKPAADSSLADEILSGMAVEILSTQQDWALVETEYRYQGYARLADLITQADALAAWQTQPKAIIARGYVDLLSLPKVQGVVLKTLYQGSLIADLGPAENEGWRKIGLCDGTTGYIPASCLGDYHQTAPAVSEDDLRARIVKSALTFQGAPYRWGGRSPQGVDCSGLCSEAYRENGMMIYRDAQIREGFPVREIPFSQLKPADLIFFPGHMAMYLGDGQYLHSSSRHGLFGVTISSFNPQDSNYLADLADQVTACGSAFLTDEIG